MNSAHSGIHRSSCESWMWRRLNSTWTSWFWASSSLPCDCWRTLCSGTGSSLRDRILLPPLLGRKPPAPAPWDCFKLVDLGIGCWCNRPPLPQLLHSLAVGPQAPSLSPGSRAPALPIKPRSLPKLMQFVASSLLSPTPACKDHWEVATLPSAQSTLLCCLPGSPMFSRP